jgi:hypothetical protein
MPRNTKRKNKKFTSHGNFVPGISLSPDIYLFSDNLFPQSFALKYSIHFPAQLLNFYNVNAPVSYHPSSNKVGLQLSATLLHHLNNVRGS